MTDSGPVLVMEGLVQLAERLDLHLCSEGLDILRKHVSTLWVWNRKMNLVGDLSVESAISRHYGESLFLASFLKDFDEIVDYGSGAGFPGVGVAATLPKSRLTLLEARQKRAAFLREAFRGCGHVSVRCVEASQYREPVKAVVSRAVSIEELVAFAAAREAALFLLVGGPDARSWRERILSRGGRCEVIPVPWRAESFVLWASSLEGCAGHRTRS